MSKTDWSKISLDNLYFDHEELKNRLVPVLGIEQVNSIKDLKQWSKDLQESCRESLAFLFPLSQDEKLFLDHINNQGEIKPELLTDDPHMISILKKHPALSWKVFNVRKFKKL